MNASTKIYGFTKLPVSIVAVKRDSHPLAYLFPDAKYQTSSLLTNLKAKVSEKFIAENAQINKTISDVIEELLVFVEQGLITHIVLYGPHRAEVLVGLVRCRRIPKRIQIWLFETESLHHRIMVRENTCRSGLVLPNLSAWIEKRIKKFFFSTTNQAMRLQIEQPEPVSLYSIDTNKYPFSNNF